MNVFLLRIHHLLYIVLIFTICVTNCAAFPTKYAYIGDCHSDSNSGRSSSYTLTFICVQNATNNDFLDELFSSLFWSSCPNQIGFHKLDIRTINFESCKLPEMRMDFFQTYRAVNTFNASDVGLMSLQSDIFSNSKVLRKFIATHNHLTEIAAKVFQKAVELTHIDLSHNQIHRVDPDAFASENRVISLNLSLNSIEELNPELFRKLTNLEYLSLSGNKMTVIPPNFGENCKNLSNVDFSFNEISGIAVDTFSAENNVEILNLSFNKIAELKLKTFHKLTHLRHLQLSNNQIVEIPSFLFHKTPQIVDINFSFNKIRRIDDFAFFSDIHLNKLNLSHNQIVVFDKQIIASLSNLTHLDISWNQIKQLKINAVRSTHSLLYLDLSGNPIKKMCQKTFLKLTKLQHLNVSQISLTEVKPGTFSNLTALETLDLSYNRLKTLDVNILPPPPNQLVVLSIENNQLHELNGFTAERIPHAKIVGIDSNPFNCSYLRAFFQLITPKHLGTISNQINCSVADEVIQAGARNGINEDIEFRLLSENTTVFNDWFKLFTDQTIFNHDHENPKISNHSKNTSNNSFENERNRKYSFSMQQNASNSNGGNHFVVSNSCKYSFVIFYTVASIGVVMALIWLGFRQFSHANDARLFFVRNKTESSNVIDEFEVVGFNKKMQTVFSMTVTKS